MKKFMYTFAVLLISVFSFNTYAANEDILELDKNIIFDIDNIKNNCIDLKIIDIKDKTRYSDCKVSEFGTFGTFNNETYYYSIYCLIPHYDKTPTEKCGTNAWAAGYHRSRAIAIFIGSSDSKQVKLMLRNTADPDGSDNYYKKPEFITNEFADILYLPIHMDGTGNFNTSIYLYMNKKTNEWSTLETKSWTQKIVVPPGLSINKGLWPDLKTMSALTYLYKEQDANCCPTGGALHIKLSIKDGKITTESTVYNASEVWNN